jgi:catechol 2,3-dioxygenase-like lactoylglutathione lyase family enzyme
MRRFHVHLHVDDLPRNLAFYSAMFGAEPARVEADYAKWMLNDPPLNFAISTRGSQLGIDHLGIQVDSSEDLAGLQAQARRADLALLDEGETTCSYSRSEKHWLTDPQGLAWEHYHTLDSIPVFREAGAACTTAPAVAATTTELPRGKPVAIPVRGSGSCC